MKIKLGTLFYALLGSLAKISKASLPIEQAYKVSKLVNNIQKELETFEAKRVELVKKYSVDGKFNEEKRGEFNDEFKVLCDLETDFEFEKIKLSALSGVNLEPEGMASLEPFIENDL